MWLVRVMSLFWSLTSYNLFRWCQCQKPLTVQSVQAVSAFLGAAYAKEGGWGWHEELAMWLQGPTGISWWSDLSTGALSAGRIVGLWSVGRGLGPRVGAVPSGRPVTQHFVQSVQVVPVSLGTTDTEGNGGFWNIMGLVDYRVQWGGGRETACRHLSYWPVLMGDPSISTLCSWFRQCPCLQEPLVPWGGHGSCLSFVYRGTIDIFWVNLVFCHFDESIVVGVSWWNL